jgi:enamine deaminase RidA (YjgF/YER057c/UK114 family)
MTVQLLSPDTLHKNLAFSQVAIVPVNSKLVFVGGQNGVSKEGKVVGSDIGSQSEQAYKNLIAALEAAGASLQDVFKMTIYIVQGQSLQNAFQAAQRVNPNLGAGDAKAPIVTGIFVSALATPEYLIEIEAVAAIP